MHAPIATCRGRRPVEQKEPIIQPVLPLPHLSSPRQPRFLRRALHTVGVWFNLLPFLLLHAACLGIFFVEFHWSSVALYLGFFWLRTLGLTGGFHRYFSHRTYKTSRWFQFVVACVGSSALQRGPMWWAGEHRQHHKYSDKEGDPHSPIVKSIWWSHVGWVMDRGHRWTKWEELRDWHKYPELKWVDRFHYVPGIIVAAICYAVGGLSGLVWGFFLSTVTLYHTTFCVNSMCHIFGYRRYDTGDMSRNNWWVAVLTLGEGWHNNHHHYPSCTRQGFKWYEVDVTYIVLRGLEKVGIVWDIREPTGRALSHRLIGHGHDDHDHDHAHNPPATAG